MLVCQRIQLIESALTISCAAKWFLASCLMVLLLFLSDSHSDTSARPLPSSLSPSHLLLHAEPGERIKDGSSPLSSSQQGVTGRVGYNAHLANGLRAWRGEPVMRSRSGELPAPYLLLHEWSMTLVHLLLCGLALCLPLLYHKQAFLNCFSRFSARRWNPRDLQYRFCHASH